MNKFDIKLIIILVICSLLLMLLLKKNNGNIANVYYENKIIKTIDLSTDSDYVVDGYNGKVVIEVKNNKIRVKEEISNKHLCSKQGYSDLIICLPNKIVIKVENSNLDGVVR